MMDSKIAAMAKEAARPLIACPNTRAEIIPEIVRQDEQAQAGPQNDIIRVAQQLVADPNYLALETKARAAQAANDTATFNRTNLEKYAYVGTVADAMGLPKEARASVNIALNVSYQREQDGDLYSSSVPKVCEAKPKQKTR